MTLTIDKSKELTRKEYIDFLQKTKGETISESRISQLVSAGKLKVRDYPELGNLQLIVLDDDEQALAQARFSTSQAIHTYSYKELGLMVSRLIHDVTTENGNAQLLLSEKQSQLDQLVAALQRAEEDRDEARRTIQTMSDYSRQLDTELETLQTALEGRISQVDKLEKNANSLRETLADTQRKLDIETSFRGEFDAFKSLVMDLLQKQTSETKPANEPKTTKSTVAKRAKKPVA